MSTKYVSGRVKELKVGVSNYSETKTSVNVVGNVNVGGIVTATSFSGSVSGSSVSEWVLGADGTNHYTFTGPGLTGAENDPTIYLTRGQKYNFKNSSGGHPFRIQSTVNGSAGTAYNDGITNNDAGNGTTLIWDVQFDTPDVLYYQCTAHSNMGGKIYIGNSGNSATINNLKVTGVSTYQGPLDIESSVLITGITTIGGLVDINAGGQANTFKVEDLTDNRVVIAGTGGELEDSANLTFDGTTFNVGSGVTIYQATGIVSATKFHGDGSSLTGIDASALKFGGVVKAQANASGVVVTGVLTATTFSGSGASLNTLNASELDSGTIPDARFPATLPAISGENLTNLPTGITTTGTSDFATLKVSTLLDVDGHTELDNVNISGVATGTFVGNGAGLTNLPTGINTTGTSTFDTITVNGNAGIGSLNVTGISTFNSQVTIEGTNRLRIGDGNAALYRQSSDLIIDIAGNKDMYLRANTGGGTGGKIYVQAKSTENSIVANSDGSVEIYHDNVKKLETTSHGIDVTGHTETDTLNVSGFSTFAGAIDANAGANISGAETILSSATVSDLTNNRVVIVGTAGELEDTTKLTFDGSTLTVVGDASFTGNVSVAGTLTSEDKTNIDSLGIVTARTGVRIDSGGLVVTSGVSTFTGAIDANGGADVTGGFVANSAKISDLTSGRVVVAGTAGELEDASTFTFSGGTVTATAFAGDGSALTGITASGTGAIGGLTIKDEGAVVGTAGSVSTLDFRGSYVTAIANTGAAGVATVTLSETPSFTNLKVTGVSTFTGIYVQNDSGNNDVIIDNNFNASHVYITLKDDCKAQFGNSTDLQIYHGGSDSYIIDQGTGNIIIGANDAVRITDGSGVENKIVATTDGSVDLYYDNVKKFETTTSGVTVTGTCQATDFNSTSDIRLKDNIQVIEDPLAKLVQIEGVSFNWKENNKPALGVIADQVQEILPELVTDGDPKTVNYNGLIGLLIEAVKEQQIQINELKSKLP